MTPRPLLRRLPVALAVAATLGACQEVRVPGVYRIDIQQGNVINQEQLAALEPGMEKRKVRFILGTPMVTDAFNQDRWDYYYSLEKRGEQRVQRVVSVFFDNERLVRVGGDVRPAKGPIVVEPRRDELVTVPAGSRDEGLFAAFTPGFLSAREKFEPPQPEASPAAATAGSTDTGSAPAPAATAIAIDSGDERYLRELLEGFGRAATPVGSAGGSTAAAAQGAEQTASEGETESVFARWARRLGLKDDEEPAPPPAYPVLSD